MRLPPHGVSFVRRARPYWHDDEGRLEIEREWEPCTIPPVVGAHDTRVLHWVPAGDPGAVA